ncbi:MAG: hypothetical protein KAI66_22655, partial [Lentisphaeria bacterium]|nr:hypothetical protein [Lentisphaeria bacterium]
MLASELLLPRQAMASYARRQGDRRHHEEERRIDHLSQARAFEALAQKSDQGWNRGLIAVTGDLIASHEAQVLKMSGARYGDEPALDLGRASLGKEPHGRNLDGAVLLSQGPGVDCALSVSRGEAR